MEKIELDLTTKYPIDISTPKPYLFADVLLHKNHYTRVFEINNQIYVCKATQIKKMDKTIKLVIESNDTINKQASNLLFKKVRYELGLGENMKIVRQEGRKNREFRKSLSTYPGYRLYANSNINEAVLLTVLSQNTSFPDYLKTTNIFLNKYGKPVPWDKKLRVFPDLQTIESMDVSDWKGVGAMMQAKYLSKFNVDTFEDVETYTYYPIFERGLKGLQKIPGIASYTARILMVYAARRYEKALYNQNIKDIILNRFNLDFNSIFTFDKWVKMRFPEEPAQIFHALILDHLSVYTLDYDFDNVEKKFIAR